MSRGMKGFGRVEGAGWEAEAGLEGWHGVCSYLHVHCAGLGGDGAFWCSCRHGVFRASTELV
eukprot:15249414-Alexandrium_andersonii.AAC.1